MSRTSDAKLDALLDEHGLRFRLTQFSTVLVCHPYLGRLVQLMAPCGCDNPECKNNRVEAWWEMDLGYREGITVNTVGIAHEVGNYNRIQWLRKMMHDLESTMAPRSFELVTLHCMTQSGDPVSWREAVEWERQATPPVAERWVETLEFLGQLADDKKVSHANDK